MVDQIPPWLDSRPKKGIRRRLMLPPSNDSRPGSSVSEAITATKTTMIAPNASEMNVKSLVSIKPARDRTTVIPA